MIESVLLSVLKTSVIVSAVTLPIMVLRQLILKKRTAKWLYFLFLILFIRLVLPFDITLPKGFVIDIPEITVKAEQNIPENITPNVPISGDVQTGEPSYIVGDDVGHMSNPLPTVPVIPENSPSSSVVEDTVDKQTPSISLFEVLGFAYIVGFAIYFILQVISYILMLSYLKRNSVECVESSVLSVSERVKKELDIKRNIPIRICTEISTPTLAGLFKPMILLPENGKDSDSLEYVFRHEYTHYKHGDLYFKLLALIANCVHWFNPIIYLLRKEAEKVVEFVCDSRVVASFDGQFRSEYCNVIVDEVEKTVLHRKNAGYLTTSFTGNAKTLKERLSAILNTDKKRKGIVSFVCIMLFIAIIGVTVSCNLDSESPDEGLGEESISSNEDPKEDPVEENNETNLPDEKENPSEGELSGEPIPETVVVKPSVEYVVSDGSFYTPFVDVGEGDLINELYSYVLKPFRSEYLELVYQNEKVTVDTLDDYIIQMTVFAVFGIEGLEVRTEMTTLGYERELTIYPASLMEERAKLIYGDGVTINHATFYPLYYHTAEYVADGDYYRFDNYELEPQQLSRKSNFTEYLRSEKSGDYVYIYDRFYSLEEDGFRRDNIYACSAGECLIAESLGYGKYRQIDKSTGKIVELDNVDAILPEYKHTFKKDGNGDYHWVSTEPVTDISAIVLKEDSQAELPDAVLAEKLYNYIIKYDYRNSELVYRDGVTTAEDLSDYLKRYTVFNYFGLDGLERKLSGHLWQDDYMARIVFIYPESLMNERIKMIFGKDATVEHGDSSWVDGLSVVYSATDKCYYISAYDGGGDSPNLNYVYFAYYKNNGNEFIIYDRYAYVEYSSSGYDVYQGSLGKEYVTTISDVKSVANYATVYKHTFKKASDGSYYWYSTEQADVTNNIAAEVGFENIIPTEKGSVEEPENPVDPWSPAPPFPEPPLPVPVPVEVELPDPIIVTNMETGETNNEYVEPFPEDATKEPSSNTETVEQFEYEPLSMFQVVSADEALRITGGKITPCPDYNQNGWSAYLTPSGMLVYMDEWLYGRLPEGTNDFTVDMYAGEGGNIGVQVMDSRYDNANVIDIEETLVELDGIKCTVYVSTNEMNDLICYGIPNEGRVVYSYGFNVKSDDYKDHTLKIKVFNSSDEFEEFVGPADSTVYVGYRSRYMGMNPTMPEWNVTAEICNAHGEVVHTEEFKVRECREMNGVLLQMLPK